MCEGSVINEGLNCALDLHFLLNALPPPVCLRTFHPSSTLVSCRHAVITDQNTGEKYVPLSSVYPGQKPGQFTVSNSSLSE